MTVAEITTKGKGYRTEINIGRKVTVPRSSFVHADGPHTVPKQRLDNYVGTLDPETMQDISRKVILALELEGSTYDVT
jgi:mRNA-degrading endonuclease toxin of MazEF toxin-antitoxin module